MTLISLTKTKKYAITYSMGEAMYEYNISSATARNWKRINTNTAGRLRTRANKTLSDKRVLPLEYMSNKGNISYVQHILDYIDDNHTDIMSVIFSLGISLLKKAGIYGRPHIATVLNEYAGVAVIDEMKNIAMPSGEEDILGLIYQSYLKEGMKNLMGAYYTPQKIARSMTKGFNFSNGELFLDPCCGSGSFLLSVQAENPSQIFGIDNDRIAVLIAKINLLLKYKNLDFVPQVYCLDYLLGYSILQQHRVFEVKADYIATNPPWGAHGTLMDETFSCFFIKAHEQLKKGGIIKFLFPEAILNIKSHRDIRRFILENAGLASITMYNDVFSGVTTKYVDIECQTTADKKNFTVYENGKSRDFDTSSIYETKNLIFNVLSSDDMSIIKIVKNRGCYSLKDSVWGLGIVTGDNKRKLFSKQCDGMEKIYTGKEITPYILSTAKNYILYDRSVLQQTARDEIYRAPEKLVYKFISRGLIFAYDSTGSLFLNSANILIPFVPSMSKKTVLAFLNSPLFQFVYTKLFKDIKILQGNLIELPFPKLSAMEDKTLSALVEDVLNGKTSKVKDIEDYIFFLYGLTREQIVYVRREINGKVD